MCVCVCLNIYTYLKALSEKSTVQLSLVFL